MLKLRETIKNTPKGRSKLPTKRGEYDLKNRKGEVIHKGKTYKNTPKGRSELPTKRGEYDLKNRKGEVIYKGKTKNINRRIKEHHYDKSKDFSYITIIPKKSQKEAKRLEINT